MFTVRNRPVRSGLAALKIWLLTSVVVFPLFINTTGQTEPLVDDVRLQVAEMVGDLRMSGEASTPEYLAYFHVPVPNRHQVPEHRLRWKSILTRLANLTRGTIGRTWINRPRQRAKPGTESHQRQRNVSSYFRMALKPLEAGVCLKTSENGGTGQDWDGLPGFRRKTN